jgi:hypothetical protein
MTNILTKLLSKLSFRRVALITGTALAIVLVALGAVDRSSNLIPMGMQPKLTTSLRLKVLMVHQPMHNTKALLIFSRGAGV